MSEIILNIAADNSGNRLFIKDFKEENNKFFCKYKSTYNDMPFIEVEIFLADGDKSFVITGSDGTVLFRFSTYWITRLK